MRPARLGINVITDDNQEAEDGKLVISTPLPAGEEGVIEWHHVRERSEEESGHRSNHTSY